MTIHARPFRFVHLAIACATTALLWVGTACNGILGNTELTADAGAGAGAGADATTDAFVDPSAKCPGAKYCSAIDSCGPTNDPSFGCAAASCAPCNVPNATAKCGGHRLHHRHLQSRLSHVRGQLRRRIAACKLREVQHAVSGGDAALRAVRWRISVRLHRGVHSAPTAVCKALRRRHDHRRRLRFVWTRLPRRPAGSARRQVDVREQQVRAGVHGGFSRVPGERRPNVRAAGRDELRRKVSGMPVGAELDAGMLRQWRRLRVRFHLQRGCVWRWRGAGAQVQTVPADLGLRRHRERPHELRQLRGELSHEQRHGMSVRDRKVQLDGSHVPRGAVIGEPLVLRPRGGRVSGSHSPG